MSELDKKAIDCMPRGMYMFDKKNSLSAEFN